MLSSRLHPLGGFSHQCAGSIDNVDVYLASVSCAPQGQWQSYVEGVNKSGFER